MEQKSQCIEFIDCSPYPNPHVINGGLYKYFMDKYSGLNGSLYKYLIDRYIAFCTQ